MDLVLTLKIWQILAIGQICLAWSRLRRNLSVLDALSGSEKYSPDQKHALRIRSVMLDRQIGMKAENGLDKSRYCNRYAYLCKFRVSSN